jgi:LmbE family N-acetylglucosaminyl deacetylase
MALKFPKNLVVFAAHPDDVEIFTGGMLKLLANRGWEITVCTFTAGGMGGIGMTEAQTIETRKAEAQRAASLLNAEYVCLDGRDGYLYDTFELRIKTIDLIRRKNAGVVIGHLPMDYHADHRAAAAITDAATMLATLPNVPSAYPPLESTPLFYHSSTLGLTDPLGNRIFDPHFYLDVSSVHKVKMEMLSQHQSQIELMKVMHKIDDFFGAVATQDRIWGEECGVQHAEAYWQHLGGGFQKIPLLQEELKDFIIQPHKR